MEECDKRFRDWKEAGLIHESAGMKVGINAFVAELVLTWLFMQVQEQTTIIEGCQQPGPKTDSNWARATAGAARNRVEVIMELMARLPQRFKYKTFIDATRGWAFASAVVPGVNGEAEESADQAAPK